MIELTEEEILNEPAGRKLDSWIAENVMGWSNITLIGEQVYAGTPPGLAPKEEPELVIPHYSTDISAAWEVVEKMAEKGYIWELNNHSYSQDKTGSFSATFENGKNLKMQFAETAPLAICRAALLAAKEEGEK